MSFADALATRNLDEIRAWPKADLHNHGFLSADRAYIYAKTGRDIAPVKAPLTSMNEMHRWVGSALEGLFAGPSGRLLGIEGAFALAMRDGVSRIELGDDVWMITQDCGTAAELYSSIADIARRMAPGIEWIPLVSMSRHVPVAALERWLHHFLEAGRYKSLDLSGDELSQPIEHFAPLYALAKANGLSLKAHVGEWGPRTMSGVRSSFFNWTKYNTALPPPVRHKLCVSWQITGFGSISAPHPISCSDVLSLSNVIRSGPCLTPG